jgi:hypothetical protein
MFIDNSIFFFSENFLGQFAVVHLFQQFWNSDAMITKHAHLTSVSHNVTAWAVWVCQMQGKGL